MEEEDWEEEEEEDKEEEDECEDEEEDEEETLGLFLGGEHTLEGLLGLGTEGHRGGL